MGSSWKWNSSMSCQSLFQDSREASGIFKTALAAQVDLILQPRKFKVLVAISLNRLSGLQTSLWYIALVPLEGFGTT